MKVIIDCFKLVKGQGKSIGIYNFAMHLVKSLSKSEDNEISIIVLGNRNNAKDFNVYGIDFIEIKLNPFNKVVCLLWELFLVKYLYRNIKADAIIFPRGFTVSGNKRINDIIVVHDLIPFYYNKYYPNEFNLFENMYVMSRLRKSILTSKHIITVSGYSKQEIIHLTGVREERVTVIHNGLNKAKAKGFEKKDYIIAITSRLPHKNAKGVIYSYLEYRKIVEKPLNLLIVGIDCVDDYPMDENIKQCIKCIRYVESDNLLYEYIESATFMLFLSEVEGFGYPPIEAMQLGTPVICSNVSSLPEVVGNAAILVPPNEYSIIADSMRELSENIELQESLINEGYNNVTRFRWNNLCKKYIHTTKAVVKGVI